MTCRPLAVSLAILSVCSSAPSDLVLAQTTQPAAVVQVVIDHTRSAAPAIDAPARPISATPPAAKLSSAQLSSWAGVAEHFVKNLAAGEVESAWTLVAARARIDEFDPDAPATFARLADLAKRSTLLGVHAYETSPTTLAEDIAADVRRAETVPEELRRRMTPKDEDEAARANATAAQWLAQNLAAEKGQPLATIVLWDATESQVVFILAKGQKIAGSHAGFQITHVVFGNPLIVPR